MRLLLLACSVAGMAALSGCGAYLADFLDGSGAIDMPLYAGRINCFVRVALRDELGHRNGTVVKWTQPVTIRVHGAPTEADLKSLRQVADEISHIASSLALTVAESTGKSGSVVVAGIAGTNE